MIDKKDAVEIIENYEYYNSGIKWTNGAFAQVKKIKITKDMVYADVLLGNDMEQIYTTYHNSEYPLTLFEKVNK